MNYSSYKKGGLLLGLVFFMAVLLYKPIGISTQFSVIGGIIQNAISPIVYEDSNNKSGYGSSFEYYNKSNGKIAKDIANPVNYGMIFLVFTLIGGVVTNILMNKKSKQYFVANIPKQQLILAFFSGVLLVFGARLAGGCTSGHMMSGLMQGSFSSLVFAMVVFIVAIPIAFKTKENK